MGIYEQTVGKLTSNAELHIPGYQFCGPGTKYEQRIAQGQRGINVLDEACREHDAAYNNKDVSVRKKADVDLYTKAFDIAKDRNQSLKLRGTAWLTGSIIRSKHFLNFY
jgi:hypothetical protein